MDEWTLAQETGPHVWCEAKCHDLVDLLSVFSCRLSRFIQEHYMARLAQKNYVGLGTKNTLGSVKDHGLLLKWTL